MLKEYKLNSSITSYFLNIYTKIDNAILNQGESEQIILLTILRKKPDLSFLFSQFLFYLLNFYYVDDLLFLHQFK